MLTKDEPLNEATSNKGIVFDTAYIASVITLTFLPAINQHTNFDQAVSLSIVIDTTLFVLRAWDRTETKGKNNFHALILLWAGQRLREHYNINIYFPGQTNIEPLKQKP